MRKVMISCAVTGSADTPGRNPAAPVTPAQIAASAVAADARLWSAPRWIVYGADAASGMGFELGSCALLRRPIEVRCCLEQIQRKVDGQEITEEPTEAPKTQIIDLMEALKASLKGKGAGGGGDRKPAQRVEGKAARPAPVAKRKAGGGRG